MWQQAGHNMEDNDGAMNARRRHQKTNVVPQAFLEGCFQHAAVTGFFQAPPQIAIVTRPYNHIATQRRFSTLQGCLDLQASFVLTVAVSTSDVGTSTFVCMTLGARKMMKTLR